MGLKSTAVATAAYAGANGATYAASPDAAPLVLGITTVLFLVFICFQAVFGTIGFMFGNFEDEDDRQDFIRQVNDPEARARRSKKRGLR
mgnify:CR=1 FL=1